MHEISERVSRLQMFHLLKAHDVHTSRILSHCEFGSWTMCCNPVLWLWRMTVYATRRLNEPDGNACLPACILYKTNGKRAVLNAYYAPFHHCPPADAYLLVILPLKSWWHGTNVVCFVSLLINRAHLQYNSMSKPNLSWSQARCVIVPTEVRTSKLGEEMRALHCPIVR